MTGRRPSLLRARLGWILLTTLMVVAGAAAYSWLRTPAYRAEADVLVNPLVIVGVPTEAPTMETEKALVSSGVVRDTVAAALGVSEHEVSDEMSVTVPADSHVLRIAYTDRDPRQAQRGAQALADAYVEFHSNQQIADRAGGGRPGVNGALGSMVGAVQGVVITPAALPRSPTTPNHLADLAVALLVGLTAGVAGAMALDRWDDRLRGPDDVAAQAGGPVLGTIPAPPATGAEPTASLLVVQRPGSPTAEAYRDLRTGVLQAATRRDDRTLLVTSPSGNGTTAVAANLAAAIAQCGRRVVLVGADLRRPLLHELFGVTNDSGLAAVVSGHPDVSTALIPTGVHDLLLLPAGQASDPGSVLVAPGLQATLEKLRRTADLVVVDAPALFPGPDAGILAESAEMVLLVADARHATAAQVRRAAQNPQVRDKLIGCVLVDAPRRRTRTATSARQRTPSPAAAPAPAATARDGGRPPSPVRSGVRGAAASGDRTRSEGSRFDG